MLNAVPTKSRQWVKPAIIVVAVAVVAALLWTFVFARGPRVEVVTPQVGPIKQTLVFSARVSSIARIDMASTVTARVERVMVREGDRVKAGQLLIQLDDDEYSAQLSQASASLATSQARLRSQNEVAAPVSSQAQQQAQTNLDFARQELSRNRALIEKGFISEARMKEFERAVAVAQSSFEQSRSQAASNSKSGAETQAASTRIKESDAALALARARLAQTRVVASADGRVVFRGVEVGDVVQPGRKLLSVAADGETRLIAQIDEKNLSLMREGLKAAASADAFPNQPFPAELTYLSPAVDATRGTVEARLRIPAPPAFLRDDMTVSVEVISSQKDRAMTLPATALREAEGKTFVLTLINGSAKATPVRVGIRSPLRVEILEGLAADAKVILDAAIVDGKRVRERAAPRKAGALESPMPGS
ncbi:MAG: efflux RND transporter periplasmic adaptor subunit [Betaproteobacteria bacterium]|nr:MAG: efflux RND transporter periplasmic adaptor subunit [Betaproteobacteria bacterium]